MIINFEMYKQIQNLKSILDKNGSLNYKIGSMNMENFPAEKIIRIEIEFLDFDESEIEKVKSSIANLRGFSLCALTNGNMELLLQLERE